MILPPFPVDDVTLLAVEHALGASLTYDRPEHAGPDEEGPWVIGADYTLHQVLDLLGGTYDPPGLDADDNPALVRISENLYRDVRVHYSERDLIRALVAEVRRLRDGQ